MRQGVWEKSQIEIRLLEIWDSNDNGIHENVMLATKKIGDIPIGHIHHLNLTLMLVTDLKY